MQQSIRRLCGPSIRNYNGFTRIQYPTAISQLLNACKAAQGYTSHYWLTTAEFDILKEKYSLTLKEGQLPNSITDGESLVDQALYNNDQFTDPYFVRLYAQTATQKSRKVDANEIKWKRIASKFQ